MTEGMWQESVMPYCTSVRHCVGAEEVKTALCRGVKLKIYIILHIIAKYSRL
jgi:hypothetical protein